MFITVSKPPSGTEQLLAHTIAIMDGKTAARLNNLHNLLMTAATFQTGISPRTWQDVEALSHDHFRKEFHTSIKVSCHGPEIIAATNIDFGRPA